MNDQTLHMGDPELIKSKFYAYVENLLLGYEKYEDLDKLKTYKTTNDYTSAYVLVADLIKEKSLKYDKDIVGNFFYEFVY